MLIKEMSIVVFILNVRFTYNFEYIQSRIAKYPYLSKVCKILAIFHVENLRILCEHSKERELIAIVENLYLSTYRISNELSK